MTDAPERVAEAHVALPAAPWARLWHNGPALLSLTMLFWAGSVIVGRAAAPVLPPVLFTLLRWSGALVIVAPLAWPHLRADLPKLWARKWTTLLLAVLGVCAYNVLVYRGLHATTAVNALLLQSVMPLAVLLANLLLFREPPRRMQVAAIAVSLLGVLVIAGQGSLDTLRHLRINPGDALVLLAVAAFATYSSLLRRRPAVHPFSFLAATFALGACVLAPLSLAEYAAGARLTPGWLAWGAIAYAVVFASFLATLFFNRGVELIGAARAGQFNHLQPVFGTLLAVVVLGESLHPYHGAGIALIAAGLALAGRR